MRHGLFFAAPFCLLLACASAQDLPPPAGTYSTDPEFQVFGAPASPQDGEAIQGLMRSFGEARSAGDAAAVAAFFADDAEWTNAFGDVVRGSDNLEQFLAWLFAQDEPGTTAGETMQARRVSVRYLGDDAAVLHSMTQSTRGPARSGEGPRRVHLTFVLAKQDGEWRIVHQMIMDARD